MHLTARTRFYLAALATAVGILALVGFAWRALAIVHREAERMELQLTRLGCIERLEGEMHELAARSVGARIDTLDRHLAELLAKDASPGEEPLLAELQSRILAAKVEDTSQRWSQAAEALSEISKMAVDAASRTAEDTSKPARRSANDLLKLGATVAIVCSMLSLLAFGRMRRERREAELHLRRSDRLAALGALAAGVAHELNNPLATISGCAAAVQDRLVRGGGAHADEIEYLGMIVDETRRCSGIVRSLRDLARDTPPAMTPSDLAALARDVVALAQMSREGPQVAFEVGGETSLEIVCDPDKIKQLLLNLIVNARDACADGGTVCVVVERDGEDAARLVVSDDGRGIARGELPHIFEPFHTDKTRGLGLGLFICERVVALHGGRIVAASDGAGRGSRFTVSLPLAPPQRPGPGVPAAGAT